MVMLLYPIDVSRRKESLRFICDRRIYIHLDYIPNRGIAKSVDVAVCNCIGFVSKNLALVIAIGNAQ